MRQLLLLRHAKSDWNTDYGRDHERPLNPRGEAAARLLGRALVAADLVPDVVRTSTAVRARTTVELAAEAGGWSCPIHRTDRLYDASPDAVLTLLHEEPASTTTLLLAGHEPTTSAVAGRLIGGACLRWPTAALGAIRFTADSWEAIDWGRGELAWLVTPKLLQRFGFPG